MVLERGNNIFLKICASEMLILQKVNHIMDQVRKTNPVSLER